MFSKRIIHALFSLTVVAFWGFAPRPQIPPGLYPWTPLGDFRPQTPNLLTPGKNPAGACLRAVVWITNYERREN